MATSETLEVRVPAFAKLNLDLRVLYKRRDGYHELRSIFQTVSLADRIGIRFRRSRRTEVRVSANVEIPDNLMVRAARLCLEQLKISAAVEFELDKRIPMGAGLGGGSSDAAAVLLALPAIAGRSIALSRLHEMAARLGSDIPFFLLGGTAAVAGRGDELYPLEDWRGEHVLLVSPKLHVPTAGAYGALSTQLAADDVQPKLSEFQELLWTRELARAKNDFEPVVFAQHPAVKAIRGRLLRAGASSALMTGSGSSVFGMFSTAEELHAAVSR